MKNTKDKSKKFAEKRREVGASGTTNFQGVIDTEEYVTDLTGVALYTTIDKMRWADASVQAAILLCELPIRSAEWDIEPAGEDALSLEIAEFVKDNLFEGLVTSWEDTLRQILLMHPYGCMPFEVVYKITEDNKIGWRKWAPRMPKTIEKWNVDGNGELESIVQRVYKDNNYVECTIPIQKLMIFTHRREGDNYLGTSILRQAYKHWFFRDKYYKIDAVAQERLGIGIPVITLPEGYTDDDYTDAENMGKNLRGHEKAYVVKKQGWEVEMLDLKASTLKDPSTMLEHHTREILKSVLAQFADLGSKSVGSFALSEDQSTLFLQSLDASAKVIAEVINDEIKRLVDYNWTVDEYPKLTHADLGIRDFKSLSEAIQTLSFAGIMTPDSNLEDYMRKVMKLPDRPEDITPAADIKQEQSEVGLETSKITQDNLKKGIMPMGKGQPPQKGKPADTSKAEKKESPVKKAHELEFSRELTTAERRVRFDEIRDFMDMAERNLTNRLSSVFNREKSALIPLFEEAIQKRDYAYLHRLTFKLKSLYVQTLQEEMKKLFEFGKLKSSYEIGKPAPPTESEIVGRINERAFFLANRHEKLLMEELKGIAAVGMMNPEVTDIEALAGVKAGLDRFMDKNLPATASLVVTDEINNGRAFTFDSFKDDVYGYQWSSILDNNTCNYCTSMDGKVIGTEDKAFKEYKPGAVHFGCRCIWVAIMKEETEPPPFTGIPDNLRPQSMVATWDFRDLEYPLPGSGGRKMPYGIGVYKEK
jgi:SPP1 gp7 family putative phage head morphogenesis protein